MAMPELTVMGAGVFGLSVAFASARRGARVRVIDPGGPGAGASGGLVGALAPHVPENWNGKKAFQLRSLAMAADWWAAVGALSGLPTGYARSGRLQPLADDRALDQARRRAGGAATLWAGIARWEVLPAAAFLPFAPASATGFVIHDTLTARLHPRMACTALAAAVRALGGEVLRTGEAAGPVVWATGVAGLADLSADMGRAAGRAEKGQALALALPGVAHLPQIFADGLHVVPHADGTVAIGSTSERLFDDPTVTDGQIEALLARAVAVCPMLTGASVVARWAGLRPRAASRAPVLGAWPGRPGQFIANGGYKIGLGIAPLAGEVMADLVLEGRADIPPEFDPAAL